MTVIFHSPSWLLGFVWALVMAGRLEWYWLLLVVGAIPADIVMRWWLPRFLSWATWA